MNIEINYINQSIGTDKACIFFIENKWYWIPRKLIKGNDVTNKIVTVPKWFFKKMKPSDSYLY